MEDARQRDATSEGYCVARPVFNGTFPETKPVLTQRELSIVMSTGTVIEYGFMKRYDATENILNLRRAVRKNNVQRTRLRGDTFDIGVADCDGKQPI